MEVLVEIRDSRLETREQRLETREQSKRDGK